MHDLIPAPPALPCGCTATTRCAWAWGLRDAFQIAHQRPAALAYTAHCAALGELAGRPPGTELWPQWADADHPDPRQPPHEQDAR